ncbi:TPA: hypothetical protein ACPZHF_004329 [Enterobacter cloacae subsp. cloacae]|uniref:hypothetical protein n=1 Tax=Enterobacter cloacae TaxID=550 RepID=UPI0021BEE482|nr:hypothetical protein [Enterobacter cloacae]UXL11516.1 hypothetical protein N7S94_06030 [Enterobacter cloacae]HDS3501909.1 hypothetical protein [Enterobacter cloacae]
MTDHAIQHVAVRFVGVFRLGCHADITANVKAYVSAFMNERGYLIIEYSDQVATLSGIGVFIVACQSRVKRPLIPAAAKEFISVLILLSGYGKVDVRTLKQRNGECRKSVPFGLYHLLLRHYPLQGLFLIYPLRGISIIKRPG